jgi:hypothetical protein
LKVSRTDAILVHTNSQFDMCTAKWSALWSVKLERWRTINFTTIPLGLFHFS